MRLNKILSAAGIASRRAADELIRQGRVELNGAVVTELGTKADPQKDDIRVDGRRLGRAPERRYLLMHKPRGVVSTRIDPQRRTTVIDLLQRAGLDGYYFPVGRLDYDSEGLLLLTNDGTLAERASHPRYGLERTYEAQVAGVPDERDLERLRNGVIIDGRRTLPATVRMLRVVRTRAGDQAVMELTIREGRNRQVRHMCDAIAHPVERLRRTRLGPLTDPRLKAGQIRDLTPKEVAAFLELEPIPDTRPRSSRRPARAPRAKTAAAPRRPKARDRR